MTEPNGTNPGQTPKDELERRVDLVANLLAGRMRKGAIKRLLAVKYAVSARTVERYLRAARRLLIRESGRSKDEHRAYGVRFLEGIIADSGASIRDKLSAQSELSRMLGLYSPQRIAHGGDSEAPPIKTKDETDWAKELSVEELKQLRELRLRVDARLAAEKLNGRASLASSEN
jgi:hypothetical protein